MRPPFQNPFQVVATTANFAVVCTPGDFDAESRARAIASTCEADLTRLEQIFGTTIRRGVASDYGVLVDVYAASAVPPGAGGGAKNWGFWTDQSSVIAVYGSYSPKPQFPPDPMTAASYAQMLFVAELAELFMWQAHNGWWPAASTGEALSVILAAELHPAGYYRSMNAGPRVNPWLQAAAWPDWISQSDPTDQNWVSFGCGVLFINYLRYQLGYPLETVARGWCNTFDELYHQVTGRPAAEAFPEFVRLIDRHLSRTFPQRSKIWVGRDNIFPLQEPQGQRVSVTSGAPLTVRPGPPWPRDSVQAAAAHERVELKAGFACEPDLYWRTWRPIVSEVTVQAKAQGFLSARFEWSANGSTLFRHGAWATAQFGARVEVREPDGTVTPRGNTTTITYLITDSWNASTLQIRNTDFVGNCTLSIEAAATEVGAKWTPVKGSTPADVMAIEVDLEDRFYDDRDRCNPQWTKLNSDLLELSEAVFILKTLPDPAPDQAIIRLLERSAEVLAAASEVGASTGQSASQVLADRMARRRLRPSFETVGGMTRTSQDLDEVAPDAIPELAPRGDE